MKYPTQVYASGRVFNLIGSNEYQWLSGDGLYEHISDIDWLECCSDFRVLKAGSDKVDFESRPIKNFNCPCRPVYQAKDEWPKVGDEVTWGNKSVKGEIKAISDGFAWIKNDYGNYCTEYVNKLQKPKKPEQELRDELVEFIDRIDSVWKGENHYNPVPVTAHEFIADAILSKYSITKKPQ